MWKRKRTWLALLALFGVAFAAYFEPGRRVRGWVHGEAFFDGRPTSYWRDLLHSELKMNPLGFFRSPDGVWAGASWHDRVMAWLPFEKRHDSSSALADDENADAVLAELVRDDNPHIRAFASDILQMCRPLSDGEIRRRSYGVWQYLIAKHNIDHPGHDDLFHP